MTKKSTGYLLPSGEAYTDEHACMMLFYPDKPAYRQALFGALDYFATWLAWETDPDKRGKDAARAWREAVQATRECLEMNACETILSLLEEIRDNTGIYCCDVVDISDGDRYTDEVEDGEGDVPQNIIDAGYADDAADWDGFDDYKCMISHLMVTNMLEQTLKFQTITDTAGAVIGGAAAVAAIAVVILTGGAAVLVYGIVLAIAGATVLYAAIAELAESGLGNVADGLAEHHDSLVCAIYNADGSAGAVVALNDAIDELFNAAEATYLKALNIPAQLKALYAGRYDQQDIAAIMEAKGLDPAAYTCSCIGGDFSPSWPFLADTQNWNVGTLTPPHGWHATQGNPLGCIWMHSATEDIHIGVSGLQTIAGAPIGPDIEITRVSIDYMMPNPTSPTSVRMYLRKGGSEEIIDSATVVEDVWTRLDFIPASPKYVPYNANAVQMHPLAPGIGTGFIDNITVYFNNL